MVVGERRPSEDEADGLDDPGTSQPTLRWDDTVALRPLGFGSHAEPLVLDWFADGRPDLLVTAIGAGGTAGRTARIHRATATAPGQPPLYEPGAQVPGLDGLRSLCALPNGASTRFDLVALAPEGLVHLPNQGEPGRPAFGPRELLGLAPDLGLGAVRIAQMVAVDWDGDGQLDLLLGLDELAGYWPDADRVPVEQQVGFNQRGGHPGYDRGGHWRGRGPHGQVRWLRNTGSPGRPCFVLEDEVRADAGPLDLAAHPAPLAIAWAGASAWELLVADARGHARLYRNFGGQCPPVLLEPRPLMHKGRPLSLPEDRTAVVAADLEGDHRAELLLGTAVGHILAVHAAPGRDEAQVPAPLMQEPGELWLGGHAVVACGDLDSDGDLDLVVGDAAGQIHLVRDLGSGHDHRYTSPERLDGGGEPFRLDPGPDGVLLGPMQPRLGYACPALVDWAGHGRLDLLVAGAGGEIFHLRNNGVPTDPRFDVPKLLRCQGAPLIGPSRVRPAAADWHGTGRLDLIALDLQGFLCVYPRTGTLEVGPPVPLVDRLGRFLRLDGSFGLGGRCSLWAGPWTGPGQLDILVGLPRGSRFVIPTLTGRPLAHLDELPTVLLLENQGRGILVARPMHLADGRPLIVGAEGCSPCGVDPEGCGTPDLLVGSDDGLVRIYKRDELRW